MEWGGADKEPRREVVPWVSIDTISKISKTELSSYTQFPAFQGGAMEYFAWPVWSEQLRATQQLLGS